MMTRRISPLLAALLGATALASAAQAQDTLTWAVSVDADSLDPGRTTTWESWVTFDKLYDTLVYFGDDGAIVPNMAKSWDVSEDGTEYTFHLNEGMMCSDGTALDANDVKYTMDRQIFSDNPSVMKAGFGPVSAVDVVDDLTVKFTLETAFGAFLAFQGEPFAGILCDTNADLADFGSTEAISSGPWVVDTFVKGDRMELVPNPNYTNRGRPVANDGPPKLDRLIVRRMPEGQARYAALQTGEVDIAMPPLEEVESVKQNDDLNLMVAEKTGQTMFFQFTTSRPPFDDQRAREAVALAIDPDVAIQIVFGDAAARERCAVGPGVVGNDQDFCAGVGFNTDIEAAKAKLAELGYDKSNPLEVTMMTWPGDNREKMAQVFQFQLAEVGIDATIETMDIGTLNARVKQENEMTEGKGSFNLMGWSWYDPDILYNLWHSPGAYSGYSSPELDSLLEQTRTTVDADARLELVNQVQEELLSKAVQVPVYTPGWNWLYAIRKDVSGFKVSTFDRPLFADVTLAE